MPLRVLRVVALALLGLCCDGCLYARILYFNFPTLDAPSYFDNRVIDASPTPMPLARSPREATLPLTVKERRRYCSFDRLLADQETRAFLVVHDDAIVYERYFHGMSAATELPAFSMTKTISAVLVGRALATGLLPSLDRSVVEFIPELAKKARYRDITLEELMRMTSGIDFDERTIESVKLYYTTDLRGLMYSYDVRWPPGEHYLYGSVNMQLMWDVLHRRLGGDTVSHYFEAELWGPLGAERPASFSLDSCTNGVEKFFGGFNATVRDYARIGLLFLHGGTLGDRTILPAAWVATALSPDPVAGLVHTSDGSVRRGRYQWFLTRDGRAYFAKGYNGQYLFVVPDRRTVIVRFGEGYGDIDWTSLFLRIADAL
jgi:CubicO group peptidase (beta-lactamase class C family)